MTQLARIRAVVEQKWNLKEDSWNSNKENRKDDGEDKRGLKRNPEKVIRKLKKKLHYLSFAKVMVLSFVLF